MFVLLDQPGDVVEVFAGASRLSGQAFDLHYDPPLLGQRGKRDCSLLEPPLGDVAQPYAAVGLGYLLVERLIDRVSEEFPIDYALVVANIEDVLVQYRV